MNMGADRADFEFLQNLHWYPNTPNQATGVYLDTVLNEAVLRVWSSFTRQILGHRPNRPAWRDGTPIKDSV